jgi:DNA (cytosine-5)-methyltransferase 1
MKKSQNISTLPQVGEHDLQNIGLTISSGEDRNGVYVGGKLRKLTPKEAFRLQGWEDSDFEKARAVNSDNQLYRQAGNGVTVPVVRAIGEKLMEVYGE